MRQPRPLGGPDIGRHLLRDEGEVIVDEVQHHWAAYTRPMLEVLLAVALLAWVPVVHIDLSGVVLVAALLLAAHAGWGAVREHRDRFVITNMRVFRIHGVLSTHLATMPLHRILDITVVRPLHGRIFGFGHFRFDSAGQDRALREVRYVGRPVQRDLAIQRVVQRAGLRGPRLG
ncbi:PH domain-containing protein [Nocardioides sp. SYSU DS0663]|uniref:PH domain-containing protein n=1 Tax=Nocardioides sp. SYSU DS0663 TaxID=3416445 RepID=UPI003F4C7941